MIYNHLQNEVINLRLKFSERIKTELACKKYLSEIKWKDGFYVSSVVMGLAR